MINVASLQNADYALRCSRGKLWTVDKQQEWVTWILLTCSQLRGKDNGSNSDDKAVGGERHLSLVFCLGQPVRHYKEETRTQCHAHLLNVLILNWGSPAGFVAWQRKRPHNPGNGQSKFLSVSRKMRREVGAQK